MTIGPASLDSTEARVYVVGRIYTNGFYSDRDGGDSHKAHRIEATARKNTP